MKPEIRNPRGDVVADATRTRWIRMRAGVQNLDSSHMADGEKYLVPEWFASALVNDGRAKYATDVTPEADAVPPVPPVAPTPPAVVETRDPVPQHRDPQPQPLQHQQPRRRR